MNVSLKGYRLRNAKISGRALRVYSSSSKVFCFVSVVDDRGVKVAICQSMDGYSEADHLLLEPPGL